MKNSSVHGIQRVVHSNRKTIRNIWLIALLAATSGCIYFLTSTIIDYLNHDVITVSKSVENDEEIFPAVTICAEQKISFEEIIDCKLEKKSCDINADFDRFQLNNLQNYSECIRFNKHDVNTVPKISSFIGLEHGFKIEILTNETNQYIVFVADNYLNSFQSVSANYLSTSSFHALQIEKFTDNKLEYPYNPCFLKSKEYRQKNCLEKCIQHEFESKFNCTIYGYYMNKALTICPGRVYNENVKIFERKSCDCKKECSTNRFNVFGKINQKTDRNSIYFAVYYGSFAKFEYSQVPKITGAMVLSNIGGTLGIFLGLRFLTIVEILEYFIELYYIYYSK